MGKNKQKRNNKTKFYVSMSYMGYCIKSIFGFNSDVVVKLLIILTD